MIKRILLLAVFMLALTSLGSATEWYVSPSGTNSAGCGSSGSPCASLQYVNDNKVVGANCDTVHVAAGNYSWTRQTLSKGGTSSSCKVTYVSDTKWGAKITNTDTGSWAIAIQITGNYVVFKDFDITGTSGQADGSGGIDVKGQYDEIRGNKVHDLPVTNGCKVNGGAGIAVSNWSINSYAIIDSNWVYNIGTWNETTSTGGSCQAVHGVYSQDGYVTVTNNVLFHNAAWGSTTYHAAHHITVANNTIFNNHTGGVQFSAASADFPGGSGTNTGSVAVNNIIYGNGGDGFQEFGSAQQAVTYISNNSYNNTRNWNVAKTYPSAPYNTPANNFSENPLFKNYQGDGSGDYSLSSSSTMIDAGTSTSAPSKDYNGASRPQGVTWDVGAYEYVTGPPAQPSNGITLVQSKGAEGSNVSSQAVSMTSSTAAGNTMIVTVRYSNGPTVSSVTDSQGHTFTKAATSVHSSGFSVDLWYYAGTSAAAETVTATLSGSSAWVWVGAAEYSGIDTTTPLDKTATANGDSTSPSLSLPTTTNQNEVLISALAFGSQTSYTATPDIYTSLVIEDATNARGYMGHRMLTSTGTYSVTYTLSGSTSPSWALAAATFNKASTTTTTTGTTVAGTVTQIRTRTTDPTTCGQNDGGIYWNTSNYTVRACNSADTFMRLGYVKASATATLDFPSVTAPGCSDLTVTAAGAASGDAVVLGVPNGSMVSGGVFFAWGSATDTITVRYCALVTGNPASGTFKVVVVQ